MLLCKLYQRENYESVEMAFTVCLQAIPDLFSFWVEVSPDHHVWIDLLFCICVQNESWWLPRSRISKYSLVNWKLKKYILACALIACGTMPMGLCSGNQEALYSCISFLTPPISEKIKQEVVLYRKTIHLTKELITQLFQIASFHNAFKLNTFQECNSWLKDLRTHRT